MRSVAESGRPCYTLRLVHRIVFDCGLSALSLFNHEVGRAIPWKGDILPVREYELTVIIHPDVAGEGITSVVEKIGGWIGANDGKVVRVDDWGPRRLQYPIKKQREGNYLLFLIELPGAAVPELERNLGLSEDILRHLIVRADE
jgi:small subunit ribosomal protein S6